MLVKKVMLLMCGISSIGIIEGSDFHRWIIVVDGVIKAVIKVEKSNVLGRCWKPNTITEMEDKCFKKCKLLESITFETGC
jgi:hypothetical protein